MKRSTPSSSATAERSGAERLALDAAEHRGTLTVEGRDRLAIQVFHPVSGRLRARVERAERIECRRYQSFRPMNASLLSAIRLRGGSPKGQPCSAALQRADAGHGADAQGQGAQAWNAAIHPAGSGDLRRGVRDRAGTLDGDLGDFDVLGELPPLGSLILEGELDRLPDVRQRFVSRVALADAARDHGALDDKAAAFVGRQNHRDS